MTLWHLGHRPLITGLPFLANTDDCGDFISTLATQVMQYAWGDCDMGE
jgi:hypothetical protein